MAWKATGATRFRAQESSLAFILPCNTTRISAMKRKEIEFDAEALVGSVEAFAKHLQGKQKLRRLERQGAPVGPLPGPPPAPEKKTTSEGARAMTDTLM